MAIKKFGAIFYKKTVSFSRDKGSFNVLKNQVIISDSALRFVSAVTYVLKID